MAPTHSAGLAKKWSTSFPPPAELSDAERESLNGFVSGGSKLVRKVKRAQILLAADQGYRDKDIAELVRATSTVYRAKKRFVERPFDVVLDDEPRPGGSRKLTGREETLLVAKACPKPPKGRAHWTMQLLAEVLLSLTDPTGSPFRVRTGLPIDLGLATAELAGKGQSPSSCQNQPQHETSCLTRNGLPAGCTRSLLPLSRFASDLFDQPSETL